MINLESARKAIGSRAKTLAHDSFSCSPCPTRGCSTPVCEDPKLPFPGRKKRQTSSLLKNVAAILDRLANSSKRTACSLDGEASETGGVRRDHGVCTADSLAEALADFLISSSSDRTTVRLSGSATKSSRPSSGIVKRRRAVREIFLKLWEEFRFFLFPLTMVGELSLWCT